MARSSSSPLVRRGACMSVALLLLIAVGGAVAQSAKAVAPARGSSGKSSHKSCTSVAGCKTCSKSGCTDCKTGADLSGGKCYCPAGSGQYGSAGTIPLVTTNGRKLSQVAAAAASSTKPAHGKGKGKGGSGGGGGGGGSGASSFACAPCDAGYYAAQSKLVGSATCVACPSGTTSDVGASTCLVPAGFFYDSASGTVKSCPANKYCAGGDFASAGRVVNPCPSGSTSPIESSEIGACSVPAGSYYDETSGKVIKCPVNNCCAGGSVTGDGLSATKCPAGSTTAAVGASTIGQCSVPPGSYFDADEGIVKPCRPGNYCPGGSVEGGGASPVLCPAGTVFPQEGASSLNDCIVQGGSYWDAALSSVVQCPANKYCGGGPIGSTGKVITNCPTGATSAVGSDAIGDCVVAPGNYFDGTNVVICPAGSYCPGGAITGQGATKTGCPANTASVAGSNALGDCTLNAGYFCAYTGTVCAVKPCPINSYCPGGASITDTTDNGADLCPPNSVSNGGSDAIADCELAAGYYCATYTGGVCSAITQCPPNKYCPGKDSITDSSKPGLKNCPTNTVSDAGSNAKADCELAPGYYCVYDSNDVCSVAPCPAGCFCLGGASIEDPQSPGDAKCPVGTSSPVGSDTINDCVVAPGFYYDPNASPTIVQCPAGSYCPGGPISGDGSVKSPCPANTASSAGSNEIGDCKLKAGYYCVYSGTTCTVTACKGKVLSDPNDTGFYCPGGDSIADPTKPGSVACPTGSYSLGGPTAQSTSACTLDVGYYCAYATAGAACTVTLCEPLYYCLGGGTVTNPGTNGGRAPCPDATTLQCGTGCAVSSLPGSFLQTQCKCNCAAVTTVCDGIGQVYDTNAKKCVCDYGYYASGATGPLYCLSCAGAYQPPVPYLSTPTIGSLSKDDCKTCTFGYKFTAGSPPTCTIFCNGVAPAGVTPNSNSSIPGPTTATDCNKCAIGYFITPPPPPAVGNNDGILNPTAGETCTQCPGGTGYGTGELSSCTSECNQNQWYDTTTSSCKACPTGRVTNPDLTPGGTGNAGVQVCLCPEGSYILGGSYADAAATCQACPASSVADGYIRTVPKYGATSAADCIAGCNPGFYLKDTKSCFKCQNIAVWSPGTSVDPTGPTACYSCTGTGYIGARIVVSGGITTYQCDATGAVGNDACIPCKMCASGTIPGGYSCPA